MRIYPLVTLLGACAQETFDGPSLAPARDLTIVAHQDDDLIFMQPDLFEVAQRGMVNVYVTAGNGTHGVDESARRYDGLMDAYAPNAEWTCGFIWIDGHAAEHCRTGNISLVFLGYPDGGKDGEYPNSLLHMWQGTITETESISRRPTHYTRDGLIATLREIVDVVQPHTIRTLDAGATHGRDHADHMIVGALALLAAGDRELIAYRGYNIENEAVNANEPLYDRSSVPLARYEACARGACGDVAAVEEQHDIWMHRRYAIGFRDRAVGRLHSDAGCLTFDGDVLALGACTTTWTYDGTLRVGDRCANDSGGINTTCNTRFRLDDEGHLWIVEAIDGMPYQHLLCLASTQGELCGQASAPVWTFEPEAVTSAFPLTHRGRSVVLADITGDRKADLCEIRDGLYCARGNGDGTFAPAVRITSLAIDPASLVIGDVDRSGTPDACGSDAGGIQCATSSASFVARRWSTLVVGQLAIVDDNLCGVTSTGIACVNEPLLPAADAAVIGDLDGDHQPDWCTSHGVCARAAHRDVTTGAGSWTRLDNIILADIDSDGRADACSADGNVIRCARSQGFGFGPPFVVASGSYAWIADLNGDGTNDLCSDTGAALSCQILLKR